MFLLSHVLEVLEAFVFVAQISYESIETGRIWGKDMRLGDIGVVWTFRCQNVSAGGFVMMSMELFKIG